MKILDYFSLNDTDHLGTLNSIKGGLEFKGLNVWLLLAAMLIASLGLNTNSAAVIIGAMLISPLMGPIAGAGVSLAIYDIPLLRKAALNLAIMTGLSLAAATIYFYLSPLKTLTSEMLARTAPSIFDILIAFVGGLALMLSLSRNEKQANPLAGVAIATALMPPLCTAGYGLANQEWGVFFGASYLYLINSIFIGLASFLVSKYLGLEDAISNEGETKRSLPEIKREHLVLGILALVLFLGPSVYIAWDMVDAAGFKSRSEAFIKSNIKFDGTELDTFSLFRKTKPPRIELSLSGKPVPESVIDYVRSRMATQGLAGVELVVKQESGQNLVINEAPPSLTDTNVVIVSPPENQSPLFIETPKEKEVEKELDRDLLTVELQLAFPNLRTFSLGDAILLSPGSSLPCMAYATWLGPSPPGEKERMQSYLRIRLELPGLELMSL